MHGRHGRHAEVLRSAVGSSDTECCNWLKLAFLITFCRFWRGRTSTAMSADNSSGEPAGAGEGDHGHCERVGRACEQRRAKLLLEGCSQRRPLWGSDRGIVGVLGPIFLASPTPPLPTSSHPGLSLLRRKISILEIASSVSHSKERDSARGLIADIAEVPFMF